MAAKGGAALASEEARWVHAAAAGDGGAFAALYQRYAQRAFNLAYRTVGSEEDAARIVRDSFATVLRMVPQLDEEEPAFQTHLFGATHTACHELMEMRHHRSQQEAAEFRAEDQVHQASMRLPERQREVLVLCELEKLSYEEIATVMELNRDSVGKLISRARINLSDELQGTVLASVAAPSPECDRALPLIAARQDEQLDAGSDSAAWLDGHVAECGRCRLAVKTTEEAAVAYRTWAPIAVVAWLFRETMAKAAGVAGADWSERTAENGKPPSPLHSVTAAPPADLAGPGNSGPRRRRLMVAAGLGALLLAAGGAAALVAHNSRDTPARPAATTTPQRHLGSHRHRASSGTPRKPHRSRTNTTTVSSLGATTPLSTSTVAASAAPAPVEGATQSPTASHPHTNAGGVGIKPTRHTSTPKATAKPATTPAAAPAPQPETTTTAPAPTTTATTTPTEESGKHHEPPGKAVGRPPKE